MFLYFEINIRPYYERVASKLLFFLIDRLPPNNIFACNAINE